MPFLRLQQKKSTTHSLRAYLEASQESQILLSILNPVKRIFSKSLKRVSCFVSNKKLKASMTLEASFVLPFFLLGVINIIFSMNIIGTQSRLCASLHQVGNQIAFSGYAKRGPLDDTLPCEIADSVMTKMYAHSQIIQSVGEEYLDNSCVVNGRSGIRITNDISMSGEDYTILQISYQVKPFSSIMGFNHFSMGQRYYGRSWTGYDVACESLGSVREDPMVYVTENGDVYHMERNCSHLNPKITVALRTDVGDRRNAYGEKYYPCEYCGKNGVLATVFITPQGNRYHNKINCSGLKRTIYTVPLSKVTGKRRCATCG